MSITLSPPTVLAFPLPLRHHISCSDFGAPSPPPPGFTTFRTPPAPFPLFINSRGPSGASLPGKNRRLVLPQGPPIWYVAIFSE